LQLFRDLGARYSPDRACLDRFELYHPAQRAVLIQVKAFAARLPDALARGEGLIFYGPVGTGKDHLLAALLHQAAGKHSMAARWFNAQEFFASIRDRMSKGWEEGPFIQRWIQPQVLGISDLIPPMRDPSAWNIEVIYRLIDKRYGALKSTWVTVNAASEADAYESLSGPVFDRLQESSVVLHCNWPSYRERTRSTVA
jgi:DNA replication protein DnaC